MGDRTVAWALAVLLLLLVYCSRVSVAGNRWDEWGHEEEEVPGGGGAATGSRGFVLEKSESVVKTDGGEVRVVKGYPTGDRPSPIHIGFISMEPNTLFIPQYLDASLILFVRRGDAKIGWIHKDKLVEKQLKVGDVNRIAAGSTFYMVNTGKGQRLQVICAIDKSAGSLGWNTYQSFFVGGGQYPKSVLAGFDAEILMTAFNVSSEVIGSIFSGHTAGPIVYLTGGEATEQPHGLGSILLSKLKAAQKNTVRYEEDDEEAVQDEHGTWTWRELVAAILGGSDGGRTGKKGGPVRAPDSYNLFDRDPDVRNNYGWTIAIGEHDYKPLERSDIGVYLVNLTAGSMLAPHVNPRATEYGVVLSGSGTVHVVYPNGTAAARAEVAEGDVFWVPRYFPFCHVASRSGPMVFFGFTTSARRNRPQFLAGSRSVVRTMLGPELAAGFSVPEELLEKLVTSQRVAVILPPLPNPWEAAREGEEPVIIKKRVVV